MSLLVAHNIYQQVVVLIDVDRKYTHCIESAHPHASSMELAQRERDFWDFVRCNPTAHVRLAQSSLGHVPRVNLPLGC